jgi:hypothetical protein
MSANQSTSGSDSLLPPGQSLKDDVLAIYILGDGILKLMMSEIANKASYDEQSATAAHYRVIYQAFYDSLDRERLVGPCPRRCNGVCTDDPCLDLSR